MHAFGEMIAQQKKSPAAADQVRWNYRNPVTGNQRGAVNTELDPLGVNHGLSQQQPNPPIYAGDSDIMNPGRYSDAFNGRFGCTADGAPISCDHAFSLLGSGAAEEVVAASAYYTIRNKATGKIISSGAFLLNSGAGVGMAFSSAFDGMGIIRGTVDFTDRQIRGATSRNGTVNWSGLFTSLFGGTLDIEDGGDTSSLAGWGGDSSFAWVNINLGDGFAIGNSQTLPCPPTLNQLVNNRQLQNIFSDLLWNKSGHRTNLPLENGGWIYQYTSGRSKGLFFFQPIDPAEEAQRRRRGRVDLNNPPNIRNARVIALVHTHPYSAGIQNNANTLEGRGEIVNLPDNLIDSPLDRRVSTGPSNADADTTIPSIIVYEAVREFGKPEVTTWYRGVGPARISNSGCK